MVVMALASVIIGRTIFGRLRIMKSTTSAVIGACIYKACLAIAMQLGLTEAGAQVWEPGQVVELVPAQAVSAGTDQTVCLLTDGEVQAWGSPAMGQLGSGTPQEKAAEPDVQTADAGADAVNAAAAFLV